MRETTLNLGAGKYDQTLFVNRGNGVFVHVDRCYRDVTKYTIEEVEREFLAQQKSNTDRSREEPLAKHLFCKSDVFTFLDNFNYKFDKVIANRIFEHLDYASGEIGRMIEALNMITNANAELEFIVPNHILVAQKLLAGEENGFTDNDKMVINTEFCNCRPDPHLSIWTPRLATIYFEAEKTWHITNIQEQITFARRDIYMKIMCSKS